MFRRSLTLLAHARKSHTKMSARYDAIIIGSGQGGSPLATAFASAGRKTAIIESTHAGGTCVNEGCTPTKTMVASGRVTHVVNNAKAMGVEFDESSIRVNFDTVQRRRRGIVDMFRGGSERRITDIPNLDYFKGHAKFVSSTDLEITLDETQIPKHISGDKIFINAGCSPATLKIPGADTLDPTKILNSTSIMEVSEPPQHLLVIGGGPIGLEFAQLFRRFGSKVSIIARSSHILPNEDIEISNEMEKILTEDGVTLYTSATSKELATDSTGNITLQITTKDDESQTISASHILNATGRTPNTAKLNLEAAGIPTDQRGFIKTNEYLETSVPNIYALGDIKGGPQFTHISYDDFRILKHNILTHPSNNNTNTTSTAKLSTKNRQIPYCIFTDPQLGRIGLTEKEARKLHPEPSTRIAASTFPMSYIARPLETEPSPNPRGLMKAVIDRETDQILGFACLGVEGGEVMTVVQVAMMGGVTWRGLRDGTFAHPCLVEGLNGCFGAFGDD